MFSDPSTKQKGSYSPFPITSVSLLKLETISVMGAQTERAGVYSSCCDLREFSKYQCCSINFCERALIMNILLV